MKVTLTPDDLIKYEEHICELFSQKKIKAPIHLDNDNEEQLINVFENFVDENDWILGSWRTHAKTLLKGVPQTELTNAILEGKSISLCFPKYKTISSAIVGGILPIAVGIAMGIKMRGDKNKVVCFMGETTSETGIAHECIKYVTQQDLPLLFVIEDNGKSVCTSTRDVWNMDKLTYEPDNYQTKSVVQISPKILYFKYQSKYPHAGGLERVNF